MIAIFIQHPVSLYLLFGSNHLCYLKYYKYLNNIRNHVGSFIPIASAIIIITITSAIINIYLPVLPQFTGDEVLPFFSVEAPFVMLSKVPFEEPPLNA